MAFLQFKIYYSVNTAAFYREVVRPLDDLFAANGFTRWSMARGWAHGPHYLLTFDTACPHYVPAWTHAIDARIARFLAAFPSAPVDPDKHRQLQRQLNRLEQAGIDPERVDENNVVTQTVVARDTLARKYESPEQWLSVFDSDAALRPLVTARWLDADVAGQSHEPFATTLMFLLACVYTPVVSGDPERPWYDGFLSFYSNFLFWQHGLHASMGAEVMTRFEQAYAEAHPGYLALLSGLEAALTGGVTAQRGAAATDIEAIAVLLGQRWRAVQVLAQAGHIHARSPFAPQRLAEKNTVSGFHQKFFYNADGSANLFSAEFAAYRWLLNIVYRTLPLLNIAPLARQRLNYALDRLHSEQPAAVGRIRAALLDRMAAPA